LSKGLLALLASVVAIALVAAGCGSSSDTTGSTEASESSLTKAEFVKKGNAICAAGNKEIEEQFADFAKEEDLNEKAPPTKAQSKNAAEKVLIPTISGELEGLRNLGTPEGDEGEVDAILTAAEEGLEKGEEDPVALIEEEGGDPFAKADELANEYGLSVCGEEDEGNEEG
jgi:hypothetical protein